MLLLPLQRLFLLAQQAQALFQPRAPRLQLIQGERFRRLRVHQPLHLALGGAPRVLELADPRTRVGGQSLAGTGPPERFGEDRWGTEELTDIRPDPRIEPIGPDRAHRAAPGAAA